MELKLRYFSWLAIAFVAVAVVAALLMVGSPARQRAVRFDRERVNDLQSIQYGLLDYFTSKGSLPAALDDLRGFNGFSVPKDPETGGAYEYVRKGPKQFQLCASFALESNSRDDGTVRIMRSFPAPQEEDSDSWRHGAGRDCFEVTMESGASRGPDFAPVPAVTVKPVD